MLDLWFRSWGIAAQTSIAVAGADDAASIQMPALVVSSRFDFTISRLDSGAIDPMLRRLNLAKEVGQVQKSFPQKRKDANEMQRCFSLRLCALAGNDLTSYGTYAPAVGRSPLAPKLRP